MKGYFFMPNTVKSFFGSKLGDSHQHLLAICELVHEIREYVGIWIKCYIVISAANACNVIKL
jgi:hypothetical protein